MKPFEILGRNFNEIKGILNHSGIDGVFDELEEDEEQEYSVSAEDGSWEISLGEGDVIETIFLYNPDTFKDTLEFDSSSPLSAIEKLYGPISRNGQQTYDECLGEIGAWERFDNTEYSLHIEHNFNSPRIKTVTIMLPEIAP